MFLISGSLPEGPLGARLLLASNVSSERPGMGKNMKDQTQEGFGARPGSGTQYFPSQSHWREFSHILTPTEREMGKHHVPCVQGEEEMSVLIGYPYLPHY